MYLKALRLENPKNGNSKDRRPQKLETLKIRERQSFLKSQNIFKPRNFLNPKKIFLNPKKSFKPYNIFLNRKKFFYHNFFLFHKFYNPKILWNSKNCITQKLFHTPIM